MAGQILREIFTRLGFETDPMSLKRYEEAIAQTQKTMSALGQTAADMGGRLSQAMEGATALAREGSDVQQIATAFEALGGTAEELEKLRSLSGGLVPDSTLQRAANLGKLFKLPAEQIPSLLKIAQGASVALGTSVEKNLEDVFVAMARQSKLIADNLGTQMGSIEDINEAYAKKNKLDAKSLDDTQKMNAFIETFIEKSDRQADLAEKAAQNQFALMDAQVKNLRNKAALFLNQIFGSVIKDLMKLMAPVNKLIAKFEAWWSAGESLVEITEDMHKGMSFLQRENWPLGFKIGADEAKRLGLNTDKAVTGVTNGERVLRRIVLVVRVLAGILAGVVAGKISAGIMGMVQHVWSLVKAIRLATIWSAALKALWAAIPLLIAAVGLLVEDAMVWLRGGDSLIGRFIKKYEGSNGPAGKIARWLVSIKPQLAKLVATVQGWIAKLRGWAEAAVDAVKDTIPPVLNAIKKAVAWVKPYAVAAWDWLKKAIPAAINGVIAAAVVAWDWLKGAVSWLWTAGPEAASAVGAGLSWLWGWIKRIAIAVKDAAVAAWDWAVRAGTAIAAVARQVGAWLWSVAEDLYTAFAPWAFGIGKLVQGAAKVAWGAIKGVGVVLWEVLQGIWPVVKAIGVFLWENIPPALDIIIQAARIIWHGVLLIVEWVGKAFAALAVGAEWILDKAAMVVEGLIIAVGGFAGGVVRVAGELVGWVIEKLSPITAWIFGAIASVGGWIAGGLEAFNNGVKAFVDWLDQNLVQPISSLFGAIGGVIKDIFNEVKSWIQPVIDLIDATLGKAHKAAVMLGLADEETTPEMTSEQFREAAKTNKFLKMGLETASMLDPQMQARLGALGGAAAPPATVNAGGVTVQIQGSTNMGAQDIATATKSGVEQGMGNVGRDLAVGE